MHPKLTLTGLYNVLEKVRAGTKIEGRDKEVMTNASWGSCAASKTASTPSRQRPNAGPWICPTTPSCTASWT